MRRRGQLSVLVVVVASCRLDAAGLGARDGTAGSTAGSGASSSSSGSAVSSATIADSTVGSTSAGSGSSGSTGPGSESGDSSTGGVPWGPFGEPVRVDVLSDDDASDDDPSLPGDMLELFFASTRNGDEDIFVSTRAGLGDPWSPPVEVDVLNSNAQDNTPTISHDGLLMLLSSDRPGSQDFDIWVSGRAARDQPFSPPVRLDVLSSPQRDIAAMLTADSARTYWCSDRPGGSGDVDVWTADVRLVDGAPTVVDLMSVAELATARTECAATLRVDQREIFFDSNRDDFIFDIWRAERRSPDGAFVNVTRVDEVSSDEEADIDPWLTADGQTLYFASSRDGTLDIWMAER